MGKILLHKEELPIIDAAIKLGDWFSSFPELDENMLHHIKTLQNKLRSLPNLILNDVVGQVVGQKVNIA